jgi:hypothetical protein
MLSFRIARSPGVSAIDSHKPAVEGASGILKWTLLNYGLLVTR